MMTRQEVEQLVKSCSNWQLSTMMHDNGTVEIKQLMSEWWSEEDTQEVDTILETVANGGQATRDEEVGATTVVLEDCVVWWWW